MRKATSAVFCFGKCQKLLRPAARRVRRDAICGCWVRIGYPQIPQIVLRRCACDELRDSRGWSRPPWGPPAAGVVLARFGGVALNECARRHFPKLSTSVRSPPAHTSRPPSAKPRAGFDFSACAFARERVQTSSHAKITRRCNGKLCRGQAQPREAFARDMRDSWRPCPVDSEFGSLPTSNPELHASPDSGNASAIVTRLFLCF